LCRFLSSCIALAAFFLATTTMTWSMA
jgi:hypothetical protein